MAFVLDKLDDMRAIYETAKKVYSRELTINAAIKDLSQKTAARESSLKMYIDIYAYMRKGKTYKMGTSEGFTRYLLENILRDEGEDAFLLALSAAKSHAIYRETVNNAQPGIHKACTDAISASGLSIDYDRVAVDTSLVKQSTPPKNKSGNGDVVGTEISKTDLECVCQLETA